MNLPSMTGLELLRRLRDNKSDLPVVMITGRGDAPTRRRVIEAGASSHIEKPLEGELLVATIRSLTR